MEKKILILSASAGAGHLRAADAIEKALRAESPRALIKNVDVLTLTNKLFRRVYSQGYLDMVAKAPELLGWLYDALDKPWRNDKLRVAFDKLNTVPFVRMLKEYQPDQVVCTHFLPSEIISQLKRKKKLSCSMSVVVTDLDVHAMWLCKPCDHFFVALDETKEHLASLGISREVVSVTGIPIDPIFCQKKDKVEMRLKHGLDPERTTILVSAGGFGVGPVEHLIQALSNMKHPVQVVAIAGRSAELKTRLEKVVVSLKGKTQVNYKVIGFTSEMDELMSASDLVLGKPGGLTTSEALAKGLVFVVVNPIPGQEERNSDHLLEKGMAIRCNNLPVLAFKIDQLLDNSSRLKQMKESVLEFARPDAAQQIARWVLSR